MAGQRVVIVGGGFGGLVCARKLDGGKADVLLVDSHNFHLFTPLLYQVATALLNPPDIAHPFRAIFRKSRNVRFHQAYVTEIDLDRRRIATHTGDDISYDYLVLATGSTNNYFGNRELAEVTLGMKTLGEAEALRNHVLACLERATHEQDTEKRRSWLTFVVVGAGPTGVEYAGALNELLGLVLGRDYPELRRDHARIVLVEGHDEVLGAFHEKLGRYARRVLEKRGIEVHTGALVQSASEGQVALSTGEQLDTHTIVWSAGVRPFDPMPESGSERSRSKRLEVDERLRLPGRPEAFAIGDVASVDWEGEELPMLSPPAMQAARYVAGLITDELRGRPAEQRKPFRYHDKGTMATIGRNAAVAEVWGLKLKGFPAWIAWLVVHLYYIVGFRSRLAVFTRWGWTYAKRDRPIRLIVQPDEDPVTDSLMADQDDRRRSVRTGQEGSA